VFLALLVVCAIAAPLIVPHDPDVQSLSDRFSGYSWTHPFATDEFGRDVLSRLIYAARIALVAPLISVAVAVVLGVPLGMLAGVRGGIIDAIAGRAADTLLSLPGFVSALAVVAVLGPSLVNAMIAVGVAFSPGVFRVVRGATMDTAKETYIESARAIGCSTPRTLGVHVLPNIAAPLLVQVTLLMGISLLVEAGMSFLGLGVQAPQSSWGTMLRSAYNNQNEAPLAVIPPGVALLLTVLAFNTIGDALRDILKARGRR
jgi:peptide/nickel transport system permease protein